MDKNTITGLVLMAAVMFGFLWLSKPSEADIAAENARREQAPQRLRPTLPTLCSLPPTAPLLWPA